MQINYFIQNGITTETDRDHADRKRNNLFKCKVYRHRKYSLKFQVSTLVKSF